MSFPSGLEHKSYIALCRELRLERELEEGDYFAAGDPPAVGLQSEGQHYAILGATWIPRLDQLVVMLVAAGVTEVCIARVADGWETEGGHRGSSPEEAALRLWAAVTGRQARP